MKNFKTARRAALLGCASMAIVALTAVPSHAEQQLFKFFVNKAPATGVGNEYFGPACDHLTNSSTPPGHPGCMTFATTSSGAGAMSEASSMGIGTHGGAIAGGSTLNDAFDGYGGLTGGTLGEGTGAPNAPIDSSTGHAEFGGLTIQRQTETTHGNPTDPDNTNPDGTTAITAAYTAHGIPNVARFVETISNNTAAAIDTVVSYENNLGSDSNTKYFAVGANNQYLTSQQFCSGGGTACTSDPTITAVFGNNAYTQNSVHLYYGDGNDNPEYAYDLDLAPGQTVTVMTFVILTGDVNRGDTTDANANGIPDVVESDIALGQQLADMLLNNGNPIDPDSWIFTGMTADQIAELINWNVASADIDTSQAFFDENSYAARQTPATFNGGTLKPTTSYTFAQDFTIDAAGGTVDDTNGNVGFTGVLSGAGALNVTGAHGVVLTANNTYTGGTSILSGILQLGDGGTAGSVTGDIVDNGTLMFNRSNTITYGGVISGTGGVSQVGAGTVALTGASTYTGATLIMSGILEVDGSISHSAVTVNSGGTLAGHGTVGATTVKSGGVVSPGGNNVIATLSVHGNLALLSGSAYDADITTTTGDLLAASGTANLAGALDINVGGGLYTVGQTFKLLSAAGGVSGAFSTFNLSSSFSSAIKPKLTYDGNDVFLTLAPNAISPFLPASASINEKTVAANIDALLLDNKGDAFIPLFSLSSADLQDALDHLSGEISTTGQQAGMDMSTQFLNLMIDPFIDARGGMAGATGPALAFTPRQTQGFHVSLAMTQGPRRLNPGDSLAANAAANENPTGTITASAVGGPLGVWVSGYGNVGTADGDAAIGSHNTHANNVGVAAGFDVRLSDDFVVGVAGGSARLNYHTSDALGRGKANVSQGGFYMSDRFDEDAYLSLAGAYSNYNTRTNRIVDVGGIVSRYTTRFNAHDYGIRLEGGKTLWNVDDMSITPYGALVANQYATPAHTEKTVAGSSAYALDYSSETRSETKSELGFKFDTATETEQVFFLHASAAWQYDFSPNRNFTTAAFAGLGGPDFTVQGAPTARNAALVSFGVDTALGDGFSIGLKANGLFSNRTTAYGGTGAIQYRW